MSLNWSALGLVAIGGALGSVARAVAGAAIPAGRLPWGTIVVNIAGCLLIGWLLGHFAAPTPENARAQSFWVLGVCGGFTTFSSFSWQTLEQMQKGNWGAAAANVLLSVAFCLAATWLGWKLAQ